MAKYIRSQWLPYFWKDKPWFDTIGLLEEPLSRFANNWPTLADLQDLLKAFENPIRTGSGALLNVVPQDQKPRSFAENYAPRIYLRGEIQTRTENWHDFFQFLSWLLFPTTKVALNTRHYHAARQHNAQASSQGSRSTAENLFSLFDEGGALVFSSDAKLLQLIADFNWTELFWTQRSRLQTDLRVLVFGHALNEKLINPYIGMTANCLLLNVDKATMALSLSNLLKHIDQWLAQFVSNASLFNNPRDLTPFPILGLPGWHEANDQKEFFDNTAYFRPPSHRPDNSTIAHRKIHYAGIPDHSMT